MPRTPSLDALRVFVVAARHRSFTGAANELNLTQSAISHRIRALEEELGMALFQRLTRRLEVTPRGRVLAEKIELAIGKIDRSIAELTIEEDSGPLKVTMLPSVATHWLLPRLPRLLSAHRNLGVQVIADPRPLDLRAEAIDVAIRFCRTPCPDYAATRLMGDQVVPVCAPELLRRNGPVQGVDALLALPLLHDSGTIEDGSGSEWRSWLAHHRRPDLACHAGQRFSDANMLIDAAALGLGVALARASLIADRLASGALVCALPLSAPTTFSYFLLCLPEASERPAVALFRSLMIAEAATTEAAMRAIGLPPAANERALAVAA